ncbi:MMPL family transporter [Gracilibacillus oryzae]|uniref:MMPL family transporter n=1 Tax=Gracilibacillus oryzae TaxID=1672701 RepID=A0A7C8KSL6_9BACI|nr:MMPL family transporter [Gracilibacillus oryzae]KAB8136818.1 MMPL family transporter [Gracilibacillus oryzae]
MSKLFYRIGKTAYNKPWAFIASWVIILGIIIAAIVSNGVSMTSETRIDGTEAQEVLDQLAEDFPVASGGQGSFIFEVPEGQQVDDQANAASLANVINNIYELDFVVNPLDIVGDSEDMAQLQELQSQLAQMQESEISYRPLVVNQMPIPGVKVSEEGNIALFQFQMTEQAENLSEDQLNQLTDLADNVEEDTSINALSTGSLQGTDIPIGGTHEIIGLIVAGIVLVVTLGSLIAAGLPLLVALVGVGVGVGGTFAMSSLFEMNSLTPVLALMVGLAVGIDYALFIVNRQRKIIFEENLSAKEAAPRAVGTAGSAVFFAGLTVIIALCGLLVIGISFLSSMALVASLTVFIDVLVALTLLPAILGLVGERIVSAKARKKHNKKDKNKPTFASKWINGIIKLRWPVVVLIIFILGTLTIPVSDMNLGMPSGASANKDTAQRQSYDIISESFGEGYNSTLILVANDKDGNAIDTQEYLQLLSNINELDSTVEVSPGGFNDDGTIGIVSITPTAGPTDEETHDLVEYLRTNDSVVENTNLDIGVSGLTAINIDISDNLSEVFPIYIGIIVLLSLVILLVVFRSVIVPIKATVGFLLSIMATFGVTTAVFQWNWFGIGAIFGIDTGGPLLSFIPIMVTGILYGLAMDYQVFLVSSMREAYIHGHKGDNAVINGYTIASRVVVAAALIMVSVFSGFIFTDDIMIKQIGFALAFGILIDAFLIRMIFVPAVMSIFGDKVWWLPKWLDKILPNLDIEGEKLTQELAKEKSEEK